ncbi:MAG: response regulator [Halobacteriovoraceae bacterium]|nr:response regulator [Halobacteriovoraceae bacterium]
MKSILVVDDSKTIQKQITYFCNETFPDIKVITASSGEEATEIVMSSTENFLGAILDYNMKGMNGVELSEKISEKIPYSQMVLCTANVQEMVRAKAESAGLTFIEKPLTIEKFEEIMETFTGE